MSKFPWAWCPELDDDVYPRDVREFYLNHGRFPELFCPDEECRKEYPSTRIACVCCNPDMYYEKPMHFRTYPKHIHSLNCKYDELSKSTEYILNHKHEFKEFKDSVNILRDIDGIDSSLISDEYVLEYSPRNFVNSIHRKTQEYMDKGLNRSKAMCIARCVTPQKTSRLALIVDMALDLDEKGGNIRERIPLSLPNRPIANYNNAFLKISSLKYDYVTPYILCGEAYVLCINDTYIIKYKYELKNYHPDIQSIPAYTPIDTSMYKPSFLEELKGYAASGEECSVYSFSTHALSEKNCPMPDISRCVVILPRVRESIVIRKRCLKRSQKSTR